MPTDEQTAVATAKTAEENKTTNGSAATVDAPASETVTSEAIVEQDRSEKILKAKELYSHGSRNFLLRSYAEAADELSQVCALYEELHGELSDELGMPYLLYGKSLIALALDENKVIDVPDEEADDDEEEEDEEAEAVVTTNGAKTETKDGKKLDSIKEDCADSTDAVSGEESKKEETAKSEEATPMETEEKAPEETEVSSTADKKATAEEKETKVTNGEKATEEKATEEKANVETTNGEKANGEKTNGCSNGTDAINDGEKPSTSNGESGEDATAEDDEENEAVCL